MKDDAYWMREAIKEAHKASKRNEVPVGAVAVLNGKLVARAHNAPISKLDPMAHAEILCLRRAARRLQNYRLGDIILYVTLEPCAMCAGSFIWARIKKVVFGCTDLKAGALGTVIDLSSHKKFNHRFEVESGLLETECRALLQDFFRAKRKVQK